MEVQQYITMNMVIQLKHNQITYDFYMVTAAYRIAGNIGDL